jgi:hypothetical protein
MAKALIGYTGFVGSNLPHEEFECLYRASNINEIRGRSFELTICSGAPAAKWKANQDPENDIANLQWLMDCLAESRSERFVLISTVDVFHSPIAVDEESPPETAGLHPYGRHRLILEEFVRQRFSNASIVRLPALFGPGLKKNIIYDLLHQNALYLTDAESVFQFYSLERLWQDLQVVLSLNLPLVHFATAPVQVRELASRCFGVDFRNVTPAGPVRYDMRSRYASLFGGEGHYMLSAEQTFKLVERYVASVRSAASVS